MNNTKRAGALRQQIQVRLEILERWRDEGIPERYNVPNSLNKVRTWEDASLGIQRIGSPSSFTTSHSKYGGQVKKIAKILEELNRSKKKKPRKNSSTQLLHQEREKLGHNKKALVEAANQHAVITANLEEAQRDLRIARQSLKSADDEIKQLKSQLARAESSKRVARFPGSDVNTGNSRWSDQEISNFLDTR